jgi:hypothetical protein
MAPGALTHSPSTSTTEAVVGGSNQHGQGKYDHPPPPPQTRWQNQREGGEGQDEAHR